MNICGVNVNGICHYLRDTSYKFIYPCNDDDDGNTNDNDGNNNDDDHHANVYSHQIITMTMTSTAAMIMTMMTIPWLWPWYDGNYDDNDDDNDARNDDDYYYKYYCKYHNTLLYNITLCQTFCAEHNQDVYGNWFIEWSVCRVILLFDRLSILQINENLISLKN